MVLEPAWYSEDENNPTLDGIGKILPDMCDVPSLDYTMNYDGKNM